MASRPTSAPRQWPGVHGGPERDHAMRVANDVLATSPGHAVKRGLTHQCAVGLGPRVLRSGYQHDLRRRPSFFAMFRDERARGLAVKRLEWGDGRQAVHHGSIPCPPQRARSRGADQRAWMSEDAYRAAATDRSSPMPIRHAPAPGLVAAAPATRSPARRSRPVHS